MGVGERERDTGGGGGQSTRRRRRRRREEAGAATSRAPQCLSVLRMDITSDAADSLTRALAFVYTRKFWRHLSYQVQDVPRVKSTVDEPPDALRLGYDAEVSFNRDE